MKVVGGPLHCGDGAVSPQDVSPWHHGKLNPAEGLQWICCIGWLIWVGLFSEVQYSLISSAPIDLRCCLMAAQVRILLH
jgi:hypothetical protein